MKKRTITIYLNCFCAGLLLQMSLHTPSLLFSILCISLCVLNAACAYMLHKVNEHERDPELTWYEIATDGLPECNGIQGWSDWVLVCEKDGYIHSDRYNDRLDRWQEAAKKVTHWCNMPNSPEYDA